MNAYEIRTKILEMAKDHVNDLFYQSKDKWADAAGKEFTDGKAPEYPPLPTLDDVMRVADVMYGFVKAKE